MAFTDRLVAARQLLEAALPLVRKIVQEGYQTELEAVDNNQMEKVMNSTLTSFKENPLLITTLAKYFNLKELNTFTRFLNTSEVASVLKKIEDQLYSDDQQFKRDFNRIGDEIHTILNQLEKMLEK